MDVPCCSRVFAGGGVPFAGPLDGDDACRFGAGVGGLGFDALVAGFWDRLPRLAVVGARLEVEVFFDVAFFAGAFFVGAFFETLFAGVRAAGRFFVVRFVDFAAGLGALLAGRIALRFNARTVPRV